MLRKTLLFTALIFFVLGLSLSYGLNLKDGLWEITSRIEMPGMPMQMPEQTYTQCITSKDSVPKGQNAEDCRFLKKETKGDTVIWDMECNTPDGRMRMQGEITYAGTSFKGTVRMKSADGMDMLNRMSGRRVGDCK